MTSSAADSSTGIGLQQHLQMHVSCIIVKVSPVHETTYMPQTHGYVLCRIANKSKQFTNHKIK